MKNFLILMCILCTYTSSYSQSNCEGSNSYTELNINNIRAGILQAGGLWWNGSDGKYLAPDDGTGRTAIFAGGLWMAGIKSNGTVKVAASQYGQISNDFDYFPGPLHPETGEAYPDGCENWDKHFIILKSEKIAHQVDYANDNTIDNPISTIFAWPGRNNPHFMEYNGFAMPADVDLAPFVDLNGDNIYDPAAGDYPATKGDQAIWWIFNDNASMHTETNGEALGMEIQAMAYAAQCEEEAINNTTFYDFKLTYRGEETLTDFNVALWTDVDLGCYTDDFLGFDEERDMAYYYNADDQDGSEGISCGAVATYGEEIPMLGIKLMSDSDDMGVTSFTYFNSAGPDVPVPLTNPGTWAEHLNYMTGKWRDGTALTTGGNGYGGDTPVSHAFTGEPSNPNDWSMCTAAAQLGSELDSRIVMSTGGNSLNPGDVKEYSYAVIFVPDVPHPCPSLDMLEAAADVVEELDCVVSSISEPNFAEELGLKLSPNPARQQFTVSIEAENTVMYGVEIIDLAGNVLQQKDKVNARNLAFDISDLVAGMYFVKVSTDEGKVAVRKLIMQ